METPVGNALLGEKLFAHFLNAAHLFVGVDAGGFERVTHALTLADIFSNSIDEAEFRGKIKVVFSNLDEEERLVNF